MIDQSNSSPFGTFKGHGWIFLLESISSSSSASIRQFADHPGTTGQLVGGPGTLCLYRYHESPFGAYDELSYSPGWYEYLNIQNSRPSATAKRITKSYVSCNENNVHMIRSHYGIPAAQAIFHWKAIGPDQVTAEITLSHGERVIELTFKQSSLPIFTINSSSLISNAVDFAKLVPIVQPLLDGNQVPIPQNLSPHSPLLHSAPLLKLCTSIRGNAKLTTLLRAETNADLFPPIEAGRVSRYGLELMEMVMTLNAPEVVLDVVSPRERRPWQIYLVVSSWINSIVFGKIQ
jgi:hypothetical protein